MNKLERYIYNKVRFKPKLKQFIIESYQSLFSLVPVPKLRSKYPVLVREGYFFGFHDKCPWSFDNTKLLAHHIVDPIQPPNQDDEVSIGYFHGNDYMEYESIGSTTTWNWQMGSMLQWVGQTNNVILNDYVKSRHISKIIDMNGRFVQLFDRPIAAVSSNGACALSHSFIRLRKVAPAYGYANGEDPDSHNRITSNDGLYIIDLHSGEINKLFSIADMADVEPLPTMNNAYHYFSHCLFSPSGERFIFYHRWVDMNGYTWTRMFSSNLEGDDLHLFNTNGVVTHTAWMDDHIILAYALVKSKGDHYYLFRDKSDQVSILGKDQFSSDGHPQFSPDRKHLVTDTYPDRHRLQRLILYNLEKDQRRDIALIRSPFKYRQEVRCDLHPRWNRDGRIISFDSSHTGIRALCTMQLN